MKRYIFSIIIPIVLSFLFLSFLCSCSNQKSLDTYTVSLNDSEYLINREAHEIIYNETTYKFDIRGNEVTITFPDSSTYWEIWQDNSASAGWSDNFDMDNYSLANNLIKALSSEMPQSSRTNASSNIAAALLLILVGGLSAAFPYASWYLSHGWHYKNAEPSDASIIVTRISGGVAVIFGFILFFV